MGQRGFAPSGLVVALVGFGLTRFTVTLAATDTTVAFLFAGLIPLVIGLGLSTAGVLLAVGTYDRAFVRTVTAWCLVGTVSMAMLVVLTLLSESMLLTDVDAIREQTFLSTFLIGGAVGGGLTGVYAARNRRNRRDLEQQANRLVVLNRLLRDRVVNAATAIRAHQELLEQEYGDQSVEVVGRKADEIVDLVAQVGQLAETDSPTDRVDLVTCVEDEVSTARERFPDAEFGLDVPEHVDVRATDQLAVALEHLLSNAVEHSDRETPQVGVTVETAATTATVRVSDDGPGLPADQQALLERGEIAEYDDPTTGFGLNIVRLAVERFDGTLATTVTDEGTTVALTLQRTDGYRDSRSPVTADAAVSPSRAAVAAGAALVAGLAMAGAMAALDGDFLAIGSLYGIDDPLVALVTHEFHSVVFGLTYAAVLAAVPLTYTRDPAGRVAVAVVFGLSLWLFAAGLVMPVWLELVGVEATLPNLALSSLVGHTVWGGTVGLCYHAGDRLLAAADHPGGSVAGRPEA